MSHSKWNYYKSSRCCSFRSLGETEAEKESKLKLNQWPKPINKRKQRGVLRQEG